MAIPVAAKVAASVLKEKRIRKNAGKIIIIAVAPVVFVITLLVGLLSVTSEHNNAAVNGISLFRLRTLFEKARALSFLARLPYGGK